MGPARVSGRGATQVRPCLPRKPTSLLHPRPVCECRSRSTVKGRGRWGHSLLSLPVELLAELQWRDTMLPPVLIVGLQDLVVKLLGGCNEFKMETISGRRKEPRQVGKYPVGFRARPNSNLRPHGQACCPNLCAPTPPGRRRAPWSM